MSRRALLARTLPKWQQMIEEIDSLPKAKQKMISEMLSALIAQARN